MVIIGLDDNGDEQIMVYVNTTIIAEPCLTPTILTATNITNTSADLGWTSTANAWDIELGPAGFTPTRTPTITGTTTNAHNITTLTGNTSYDFHVRADCVTVNGLSTWVGPYNFTTLSVSVDENENNLGLSIYPNPNNGIFTLNVEAENVTVKVMNTSGQIILTKNNVTTKEQINLSSNAKGIYFVTVTSQKSVITKKIIVQ
mgnify:CR=1 FL=1